MFAQNIARSILMYEVWNKPKQNKNKSFSMNDNAIVWKTLKRINPKWGFTYPTGQKYFQLKFKKIQKSI